MQALEQVTVLMTLMRQLAEVMDQERRLLQGMRLDALKDLQSEKAALAEAYEIEMRRLRGAPESLARLELGSRRELEHAMRDFQKVLARNVRALEAARAVTEKLLRAIHDSLAGSEAPARGYGAGGAGRAAGQVIPVAFDRSL